MYDRLKIYAVRKHDQVHQTEGWSVSSRPNERVSFDELLERAFHNSTFSQAEAYGVVMQLIDHIKRELSQGNLVEVKGLGSFWPQASCKTVATRDELTTAETKVRIQYRPAKTFKQSKPWHRRWLHGRKDNEQQ